MGLFDFFKRKKQTMSPAFQEALKILFPNGLNDRTRQLNELKKYFGSKYDVENDISVNLIFILTGYLITGNIKTREASISSVLNRANNKMTQTDVEYLHDFALKNHPKLSALLLVEVISDTLSQDGCDTDAIPNGEGVFGLSSGNPIPVNGVIGIYDYLSRLYDESGHKVSYKRVGTTLNNLFKHPVDEFQINSAKGLETLYFSAYHKRTSRLSPSGYILVDINNVIISTSSRDFPFGYKLTPITKTLPKLMGLNSFACFSNENLIGKNDIFVDAEKINREAIVLSNNSDFDAALAKLNKAISLGSLNAVNNKFTLLHTADRFQESYEFLESIVDTPNATILGLYNLAVIYYNGDFDTNYNINKDISRAYLLLLKADHIVNEGREERALHKKEKIRELIFRLENEDKSLLLIKDEMVTTSHNKNQENLQKSILTTDGFSENSMHGLSDIYSCIKSTAETFIEQMTIFPKLSEKGKLEVEILMSAILSHYIDKNIVLQSLLSGNAKYKELDITEMLLLMDSYRKSYQSTILLEHLIKRVPLLEFCKTHGKLKLGHFKNCETNESFKAPLFVLEDSTNLICSFDSFKDEEQNANFVSANKYNIYVDVTKDGKHLFKLKRDIEHEMKFFLKQVIWHIYVSPLKYQYPLSEEMVDKGIKEIIIKKTNVVGISNINNVAEVDSDEYDITLQAVNNGAKVLRTLASSLGFVVI